jgi:DNA polymerase III subunit delta
VIGPLGAVATLACRAADPCLAALVAVAERTSGLPAAALSLSGPIRLIPALAVLACTLLARRRAAALEEAAMVRRARRHPEHLETPRPGPSWPAATAGERGRASRQRGPEPVWGAGWTGSIPTMSTRTGFAPVTLVLGEEELLAERAVSDAVDAAREELGAETTVEEVHGGALPDGFAMGLATASLFGGGRVVVVQEADSLDAAGRHAVLAMARDPSPTTVIVLRAEGVGRQAKFFKDLQEHANVVTVARLKPSERSSWLRAEVRRLGRKADDGLVAALVDTVGQDLRELAGAVAKLHVAVPPPAPLQARHVTEFLTKTADRRGYELTDAILAGEPATALSYLEALYAQGEEPIALLGVLARQLRNVLFVSERAGAPPGEVAQALGLRDWQVRKLASQARRFHPSVLRRALDLVAETDAQIRNGTPSPSVALELVVARIAIAGAGVR